MNVKVLSHKDMTDVASELSLLKNKLLSMGLYKTYHAMDSATQVVGYEMAEIIEGKHPTKLIQPDTVSE